MGSVRFGFGFGSVWFRFRFGQVTETDRQTEKEREYHHPSPLLAWQTVLLTCTDFATGKLSFSDIEIAEITTFEKVWSAYEGGLGNKGGSFYKPVNLPEEFQCLGFLGHPNIKSLSSGRILVAKGKDRGFDRKPTLQNPVDYTLVWSHTESNAKVSGPGYFWLPIAPNGYKSLGYVVTKKLEKPGPEDVLCVLDDLTDSCKATDSIWGTQSPSTFNVWNVAPVLIGTESKGIPVGSFYCSIGNSTSSVPIACLKNSMFSISSMPSLPQLKTLISNHSPTIFFHPEELYFPGSISWLFTKGVLLHAKKDERTMLVSSDGSNLPMGGTDDDEYWIDFPSGNNKDEIKKGNLSTAQVYIHAKPMLGATFTDIAVWIYYPFNGPATAKVELLDLKLGKIGEHISDWEHVTLRINNFTGDLDKVFFSQHSGGVWVDAIDLEYNDNEAGNCVVYSAKSNHSAYPHPGLVLQGDRGVGLRNDTSRSNFFLNSRDNYQIVSANYLGIELAPEEPPWLQYMRKWGPKVEYDSEEEIEKVIKKIPFFLRSKLRALLHRLPNEVFGEEGPTGPKQKSSWEGDETR